MKTVIEKIEVWRTSDGKIIENQDEAYAHQNTLVFREEMENFVASHFELSENIFDEVVDALTDFGHEVVAAYEKTRCL